MIVCDNYCCCLVLFYLVKSRDWTTEDITNPEDCRKKLDGTLEFTMQFACSEKTLSPGFLQLACESMVVVVDD